MGNFSLALGGCMIFQGVKNSSTQNELGFSGTQVWKVKFVMQISNECCKGSRLGTSLTNSHRKSLVGFGAWALCPLHQNLPGLCSPCHSYSHVIYIHRHTHTHTHTLTNIYIKISLNKCKYSSWTCPISCFQWWMPVPLSLSRVAACDTVHPCRHSKGHCFVQGWISGTSAQVLGSWELCECEGLTSKEKGVAQGHLKHFQVLTFPPALKRCVVTSGVAAVCVCLCKVWAKKQWQSKFLKSLSKILGFS